MENVKKKEGVFPIDREILEYTQKEAEKFFGTLDDPEQIPITMESHDKLEAIDPNSMLYKRDVDGNVVGWTIFIPTTSVLMNRFLSGEINERQLFDQTQIGDNYDALYLCSIIVPPEYRGKGYAKDLGREALKRFSDTPCIQNVFAWPFSEEGKQLLDHAKDLGLDVHVRKG
ncbi:MAG: GNAT family N-acetyltransferase [Candidatus Paceibacterota bacterium]|jgi:RimJ/RimL family protein N-acetyltransferase